MCIPNTYLEIYYQECNYLTIYNKPQGHHGFMQRVKLKGFSWTMMHYFGAIGIPWQWEKDFLSKGFNASDWSVGHGKASWDKLSYIYFPLQFSKKYVSTLKVLVHHKTCLHEHRRCFEHWQISQPVQDHLLLILFHLFIGGSCGRKAAYCCHQRRHRRRIAGVGSETWSVDSKGFAYPAGLCSPNIFWPNLQWKGAWGSQAFLQADLLRHWYHLLNFFMLRLLLSLDPHSPSQGLTLRCGPY